MDTLISNVTAVTMNERMEVLFGAYIGITAGRALNGFVAERFSDTQLTRAGFMLMGLGALVLLYFFVLA